MMRVGKNTSTIGLLAVLSLAAVSCSDESSDSEGAGGMAGTGGGGGGGTCLSDLVITDATNYTFSYNLTIESTTVKSGLDLTFDWSQLTQDFYGRPLDVNTDINMVLVSLWGMTEQVLTENLNHDNLPLSNNKGALTVYPAELQRNPGEARTNANLMEFNSFRNEVPLVDMQARFDMSTPGYAYPPDSHTFMLMAATGETPGKNSRMLGYFKLSQDPSVTNTTVTLHNQSTVMTHTVNLLNTPLQPVPANTPALTINWANMQTNALGATYDGTQITEAVVAHYSSYTVQQLQDRFLFLEDEADAWYWGEVVSGKSMDLSTLAEKTTSAPFPGIDGTGVWLVALFCTVNCNNPAPWSITLLTPCAT